MRAAISGLASGQDVRAAVQIALAGPGSCPRKPLTPIPDGQISQTAGNRAKSPVQVAPP